jgi:hypothetical protein
VAHAIPAIRTGLRRDHPLLQLEEDDLDFVVHFVLASGSLKEMAELYDVSYPTIRASLDRVIAELRKRTRGGGRDEMTELLAGMVERGELRPATAKSIRALHRNVVERANGGED